MKTIRWRWDEQMGRHCCSEPGDQSGEYVPAWVAERLRGRALRLLDLLAEPNEIVREHDMDNAVQELADAIAAAGCWPTP